MANLRQVVDQGFERIKVLADKLGLQSHAGFAMIVAAALDRLLEEALLTRMIKLNREMRDKLFGEYGALQGFSAKIDIAFSVGIIDRENYLRLTKIRKIRNQFAHTSGQLHFESEPIRSLLSMQAVGESGSSPQGQFIAMAKAAELAIVQAAGLPTRNLIAEIEAAS